MAARGPNVNYDDPANENFELPISTDVKGYLLESIIHGGAFGLAYKASSCTTPLDPLVLKVLRGPMGHKKKLFETEVTHLRLASALPESVRLVRLVDSFQDDTHHGCRCIVIKPLCEGGNIQHLLDNRPMSYTLPDCMRWLHEVSESLYMLGTKVKMYHGDINPRNILLKEESDQMLHAYVTDFGLCVRTRAFGMVYDDLPSAHYSGGVAPEMLEDEGAFDGRAAVWSWVVLAYALLDRSMARLDMRHVSSDVHDFFLATPTGWAAPLYAKWPATNGPPRALLDLMEDCLALRDDRLCMATVVNCMRTLTGTKAPWCPLAADLPSTGECFKEFIPLLAAAGMGNSLDPPPSEDDLARLLVISEELLRAHRRRTRILPATDLAGLLMGKAQALELREEHAESRAALVWAVDMLRAATPVHQGMLFDALKRLAEWHMRNSEYVSAVPLFQEALGMCGNPTDRFGAFRPEILSRLADAQGSAGDIDGAIAALESLYQELEDAEEKVMILANMARAYLRANNPEQALEKARQAVEACDASVGSVARAAAHDMLASARNAMGDHPALQAAIEQAQGQQGGQAVPALSVEALQQALEDRRMLRPPTHPEVADALCDLGRALREAKRYPEALEQLQSALDIRKTRSEHEAVGLVCLEMMTTALASGGAAQALPHANEAVAAYQRAYGPNTYNSQVATALKAQALFLRSTGKLPEAEASVRVLVNLMESATTPVDPASYFDALHSLAHVLDKMGASRRRDAIEAYNTASTVASAGPVYANAELFSCIKRVGILLLEEDAGEEAVTEHMHRMEELIKEVQASSLDEDTIEGLMTSVLSFCQQGVDYILSQRASAAPEAGAHAASS